MSRRPVTLSFSIGMEMVLPIMLESWRSAKTAWSTLWRATPGMPAERDSILWGAVLFWVMAYQNIKEDIRSILVVCKHIE